METILVLTDFSYTAFNAARYTINLANQLQAARVILYHSILPFPSDPPPPFASEVDDLWSQTIERLNELKSSLEIISGGAVEIDIRTDSQTLQTAVKSISKAEKVGLVVMGSTGNNKIQRLFIGGNTMSLSDACPLPLLIVPPDTSFDRIERVVFACDAQNAKQIPVRSIGGFINMLHSKLSIVYHDSEITSFDFKSVKQKKALYKLVDSIDPEFSFIHGEDLANDIVNFSGANAIQLIIVIYNQQRFLQNIFHPSCTNTASYNSHFPLLILKPKCRKGSWDAYLTYKIRKNSESSAHIQQNTLAET